MAFYEWAFPSAVASESLFLERLQSALRENRVSLEEERKFMLAVSEAFNNALIHGNELDPEKTVQVQLDINERTISADITDQGREGLKKLQAPCPTDLFAEGGRGVTLMMYCADDIQFVQTKGGGLKVSVQLRRKPIMQIK